MVDWISLAIPFAYLTILIGSLATFSYLYRSRKAAKARSLAPWFPPHLQRNIYLSLLEIQSSPDQKVPDSLLKAALLRRAVEDIHRLISIRNARPALTTLLQRGSVGDELWQRFLIAEKEIEIELRDVVNEASALAPQQNWGQTIFQSAGEMAHREILGKKLAEIEGALEIEKTWWEKKRDTISKGFMKELESSGGVAKQPAAKSDAKKHGSSDEDAVIVESGGPAAQTPTHGGGGGGGKKKKGKH